MAKIDYPKVKRVLDAVLSFLALLILSPIFLILAIAIKVDSKGSVLFTQNRIGIHKSHFCMLKFRTMRVDTPHDTPKHLLEDPAQWITKVGGFLRKTSLDELPQIWNIFVGQMSIIGPRPALWNQDELIQARDKYGANGAKPGLSGLAQINGRDSLTDEEKARLDGEYAKNMSFRMDVSCFLKTIVRVWKFDIAEGRREKGL